jgi:hypothetical protein
MNTFRIQEFAKLAGVTVRALHHYDRLKLLSPAHRSERGYRLYCTRISVVSNGFLCCDIWGFLCVRLLRC